MSYMEKITASTSRHWEKVYSYVNKAVVFIDNVSAELLHWQGGLLKLVSAGALNVKEFSSFESSSENEKKAVFIISSLLDGVAKEILQDIIQSSHFQYVVVLCSQGAPVHTFSRTGVLEEESDFFAQVEDRLLEWIGNMNYTAEVFHVPFATVSLGNSVFLTPGFAGLFPLIGSDLHQIELQYNNSHSKSESRDFESLKNVDFSSLPKDLQIIYKRFVSEVDSILSDLRVKEDIYSVGYTSGILATELEGFLPAKTRRKTLTEKASLVLVDRSLDLASTTSYNTESLLDRIQQLLPRLPGHVTDVTVDMSHLCKVDRETGKETVSPGCLATQSGNSSHLQPLIRGKQKEALMEVNRQLVEAASNSDLPVSLTGKPTKVTAEQLNSTLKLFGGKYKEISKNLNWLQVSMATQQTLSSPRLHHFDELISVEKGLLQCLADPDAPEALSQILQMLQRRKEDNWTYSLDEVLCMLVFVYSLGGPAVLDEVEQVVQEAMIDRILQEKSDLPPLVKAVVGECVGDRSMLTDIMDDVWCKLSALAVAREHLHQFKSVLDPGSVVSPASQNPLLRQLVAAILDPDKPDLPDVEYRSSGLRDKLKSGFGLFRGVTKPRPSDNPLVILFIVGGVTCTEVKQIHDLVNQYRSDIQLVVGSTRLVTPEDTVRSVLCQNNVNPSEVT